MPENCFYEFDAFRIDAGERVLFRDGAPLSLTPKAFDTLLMLVENSGRLLEKEAMMNRLWPDAVVEEANLANNISTLRKLLGESGQRIQTVPRRGYRFAGEVRRDPAELPFAEPQPTRAPIRWKSVALASLLLLAGGLVGLNVGRLRWRREMPTFTQVTFRRGTIWSARYAPDGQTIVYSASYGGRSPEVFLTRAQQPASRPLGVTNADVLAVSKQGELALLVKPELMSWYLRGSLARVPLTGGAPRVILDDVQDADWSPDGRSLGVIHWMGANVQVEYPIGHPLFKAPPPAWVNQIRISPRGDLVAFILHQVQRFDDRGTLVVLDREGKERTRSRVFSSAYGVAWAGDEKEVFVTASPDGANNALYAVDLQGGDRVVARTAGRLDLFDVSPGGSVLVAREDAYCSVMTGGRDSAGERDLSWLDGSWLRDISADGKAILFDEEATAGGATAHVYVRPTDAAPALDLGEGHAIALSADGKFVLARQRFTTPPRLVVIPVGAGPTREVKAPGIVWRERGAFLPDGQRLIIVGSLEASPPRSFVYDLASGRATPVTPPKVAGTVVDPSGRWVVAAPAPGKPAELFPLAGGPPQPIPTATTDDLILRFSTDGRALLVARLKDNGPVTLEHLDLASGNRDVMFHPGSVPREGVVYKAPPLIAADGGTYAYTSVSMPSDLFVIDGAR